MMKKLLSIIIPTWNNPQFLDPCVLSIVKTGILSEGATLHIVNNGKQPIGDQWGSIPGIEVLEPGENLGWERGLKYALDRSDSDFVCFQNDDTYLPMSSCRFYQRLLTNFQDENLAAVGPSTTTAAGLQSCFNPNAPVTRTEVNWLIFFTVMVRRSHLEAVGGIDTDLPGGDDLDLSWRFRKAGNRIVIDPGAFIIHHGFKTGNRVYGDGFAGVSNGWNSPEMTERTNTALIKKHGFKTFHSLFYQQAVAMVPMGSSHDVEGELVAGFVSGDQVIELGCGGRKTTPKAIGVDRIPKGQPIPHVPGMTSMADIVADVSRPLPIQDFTADSVISRHILEHCIDPIETLRNWNRILKLGGRMIIAVPDEKVTSGIPLNMEHCHAFTSESLRNLAEACGFEQIETKETGNGISFVSCFEKRVHMPMELACV